MAPDEDIFPPVDTLRPDDGLDPPFPGPYVLREGVGEEGGGVRGEEGEGWSVGGGEW